MMPWPLPCKIREELIHQKRNFTKYNVLPLSFHIQKRCCSDISVIVTPSSSLVDLHAGNGFKDKKTKKVFVTLLLNQTIFGVAEE